MIWTFCSSFIVVLYPLWESRTAIGQISKGIVKVGVPYARPCDRPTEPCSFFFLFALVTRRTYFLLEVESLRGPLNRLSHEMRSEMRVPCQSVYCYVVRMFL